MFRAGTLRRLYSLVLPLSPLSISWCFMKNPGNISFGTTIGCLRRKKECCACTQLATDHMGKLYLNWRKVHIQALNKSKVKLSACAQQLIVHYKLLLFTYTPRLGLSGLKGHTHIISCPYSIFRTSKNDNI